MEEKGIRPAASGQVDEKKPSIWALPILRIFTQLTIKTFSGMLRTTSKRQGGPSKMEAGSSKGGHRSAFDRKKKGRRTTLPIISYQLRKRLLTSFSWMKKTRALG